MTPVSLFEDRSKTWDIDSAPTSTGGRWKIPVSPNSGGIGPCSALMSVINRIVLARSALPGSTGLGGSRPP